MSFRRRIVLLAALAVAVAVALASGITYVSGREQLRGSVDDGLRALSEGVLTEPGPRDQSGAPSAPIEREGERRNFRLLLPSSPLGEREGYAQVVSSAGRVTPPPGRDALLA